jgi:Ca-activated chloride channel family protein
MTFLSPARLVLLVVPAALLGSLVLVRLRRHRTVVRFTALDLVDTVAPRPAGWRRKATASAALLGIVTLAVAFARPVVAVPVPREQVALVLAIDVSLSMGAADVDPTRIAAAQDAARRFLDVAPEGLNIGLVAFAGTALPVLPPESDRALVEVAVDRLGLGQGTAVGEAIFASLDQLALSGLDGEIPTAIVVLSDGETTVGRSETEAAQAAVEAGVPVFTIAFGTDRGVIRFQDGTIPVPAAEGRLREIAETTGAQFFTTATEAELAQILESIGSEIGYETEDREVTDWAALAGLGLVGLATAGSIRWFGRVV